jgi:hypothetical protein
MVVHACRSIVANCNLVQQQQQHQQLLPLPQQPDQSSGYAASASARYFCGEPKLCALPSCSPSVLLLLPLLLQYLRYMTFVVETAIKNMKDGAEQWVWMLDLAGEQQSDVISI